MDQQVLSTLADVRGLDVDGCTSNGNSLEFSMISSTNSTRSHYSRNIKLVLSETSAPVDTKTVSFGNNKSVSCSDTNPKLNMHNQSSKSFGRIRKISNPQRPMSKYIKTKSNIVLSQIGTCPNMVCGKCHCKDILKQNQAAQKIWSACYRINISNTNYKYDNREIEIGMFDGIYGMLSEYFQLEVDSNRIPTKHQISESITYFGGFIIDTLSNDIAIDRCHFISFWKWYRGITNIIKDIYRLWDTKFPFKLNLFINRQESQDILCNAPQGTFALRLSQSHNNGIVLSYSDQTFSRQTNVKHVLLIRQSHQHYCTKTNKKSQKTSSLNRLIRTFCKLKFIYTPNYVYNKNHVF